MASPIKHKQIQIQKPAQSLEHFKAKVASSEDVHEGLMKPILLGAAGLAVVLAGIWGLSSWRTRRVERHEAMVAEVIAYVQGQPTTPVAPAEVEKRMKEKIGVMEALAKQAPGSRKAATEAVVGTWKLQLEGKGGVAGTTEDPWARLRLAQRQVALGQGKEAAGTLEPLRRKADPGTPWAPLYWSTLMDVHRLNGTREQAWKDLAEYKQRYKDQGDAETLERTLAGI